MPRILYRPVKSREQKLTAMDVSAIMLLLEIGHTMSAVAANFRVSPAMVHRIRTGRAWSWWTELPMVPEYSRAPRRKYAVRRKSSGKV